MARSARAPSVLAGDEFTAEEQAAFDAMHAEAPETAPPVDPEPAPAPEPEPVEEESAPEGEPAPQRGKADKPVPLGQLIEERKARQAAEKEYAEYRQRTEDRFTQILQRFAQPQPPQPAAPAAPEIPDVTKDPIAHFQAKFDAQQREIERLSQGTRQSQQLTQQQQVDEAVRLTVQAQETKYRAAAPDYEDAVKYLQNSRREELEDLGFVNPAEREMMLQQEAYTIARRAIQGGKSFPEMIYSLAQRRGYKNAPPPAPEPSAPQEDAEQRLERQAAGQQQARTLSNARGNAPQEMTAQRLASMSEREFDAWLSKATPEMQRAVFGA